MRLSLSYLFSTVRNARPDSFALLTPQLSTLSADLLSNLALSEITCSKQVQLILVLLFSQATNGLGGDWRRNLSE